MAVRDAYLAGYFDGDGHAGMYTSGTSCSGRAVVRAIYPIAPQMYFDHLRVGHLGETTTSTGRPYYRWHTFGDGAKATFCRIGPYLRVRRLAALEVMQFPQVDLVGEEELAYLAGLLDADGTITFSANRGGKKFPHIACHMSVPEGPGAFAIRLGGRVLRWARPKPWKDSHSWSLACQEAVDAITWLLPYIVVKRPQALRALEWRPVSEGRLWRNCRKTRVLSRRINYVDTAAG